MPRAGLSGSDVIAAAGELADRRRGVAILAMTELGEAIRDALQDTMGRDALAGLLQATRSCVTAHPGRWMIDFLTGACGLLTKAPDRSKSAPAAQATVPAMPIDVRFAQDDTETELIWSAQHGMSLLERAGRMREEHRPNRIAELAARLAS